MTAFRFQFDALLRLRKAERERCQALLAETLTSRRLLEDRRCQLERELEDQSRYTRAGVGPGPIDAASLARAGAYDASLRGQRAALVEEERLLTDEIERRRQALLEADRDERVLAKLRERRQQQHLADVARGEQNELDDVAARLANRLAC